LQLGAVVQQYDQSKVGRSLHRNAPASADAMVTVPLLKTMMRLVAVMSKVHL
jgi:hypothetical protein